jgi:P-type E1-E2 ATPase
MNFWNSKIQDVLDELKTSPSGLPEDRYNELLLHSNRNDSNNFKKKNPFVIFISQFKNPLILILLLVVLVSFFTKDNVDGFVILALLMVNAILGFWQEEKAQKSLEKLRKLIKMRSKVLRAGKIKIVEAEDIVLGDIIILNKGDYIPADIRLIESNNLIVNESSLTGESLEVEKDINSIPKDFEPQDIKNSVFQGTFVTEGNARGVVVAIGKETFLGRSVQIGDKKEEQTNFAKKFNQFAKLLFIFVLIITILAFAINVFLGRDVLASFILAVTLALGVTPETMPVILSVSLASAAMRLSGKNLLIKRLTVFEDLGNIDVICSDKTGL